MTPTPNGAPTRDGAPVPGQDAYPGRDAFPATGRLSRDGVPAWEIYATRDGSPTRDAAFA